MIGYQEFMEQLEGDFGTPVAVHQYEDYEGDRVTVKTKNDVVEALNMCNELRSINPTKIITFKFFLRFASTPPPLRSLPIPPGRKSSNAPPLRTPPPSPPPTSFIYGSPLGGSSGSILAMANNRETTPPLRTPPGSPKSPPPLRTPPPSPPSSPTNSFIINNSNGSNGSMASLINPFRRESGGINLPRPSSPLVAQLANGHSPNNNGSRGSADLSKFNNFPTLIINEHEELTSAQPIHWQKGQLLGRGGYGAVYLGLNTDNGELVAVKQLELMDVMDSKYKNHENIVRYLGTCLDATHLNVFLEYVPGGSISFLLSKFGPFSENVIKVYTKQILLGLQFLHNNQIIHRDIKGANILIDTKGTVKLSDFGCSKVFSGLVSQFKSMHGTPYWMAPEVIKQTGHGRSSDIWSLACTMVEMATGQPPWANITEMAAVMYHIASSNALPNIPSFLSPEAHDFLALCFRRDPRERPDAAALLKHPFLAADIADVVHPSSAELSMMLPTAPRYRFSAPVRQPTTTVSSLPRALMIHVFAFLPPTRSHNLALVCKAWRAIVDDDDLWAKLCVGRGMIKHAKDATWKLSYVSVVRQQRAWFDSKITQTTLKGHSKCIYCIKLAGDHHILSGGDDKKLKVWDMRKSKHLYSLRGHTGSVKSVDYQGADLTRVFTSSADFTARIWNTKTKKSVRTYTGHREAVTGIVYLGDVENKVVTCSLDSTIQIWDAETGSTLSTLTGHTKGVYAVRPFMGEDDRFNSTLVSVSADWSARVWDTRTSQCVRTFQGHEDDVTCVSVDNSGLVATGSGDGSVRLWDVGTGRAINKFVPQETKERLWVWSVQLDRQKIISSGKGGVIRFWDPYNSQRCRTIGGHHETVFSLHTHGNKLLTCSKDKLIKNQIRI
eukprot:gene1107-1263_t